MTVVWVTLAGGLGAVARFVLDGLVRSRFASAFPLGTVVINVTGSFVLGVVTGLALGHVVADEWRLVVGTGFCGGYTTFSTASFETVRLVEQRRTGLALLNAVGTVVVTVGVAALGLWLGLRA
ncbi:MAG TPA: fluoride efflux transporter CrcB [Lapillicoccus sp.]|nr:fluoride efflux transporter CrcB [Lapillicoccus sp.]